MYDAHGSFLLLSGQLCANSRGSERKWPGEGKQRSPFFLEDSTSLILFFWRLNFLNATAFHLNSRGPDSDLLFFPAEFILYSIFARFIINSFSSLPPTAFPSSEMPPEQPRMTSPGCSSSQKGSSAGKSIRYVCDRWVVNFLYWSRKRMVN